MLKNKSLLSRELNKTFLIYNLFFVCLSAAFSYFVDMNEEVNDYEKIYGIVVLGFLWLSALIARISEIYHDCIIIKLIDYTP